VGDREGRGGGGVGERETEIVWKIEERERERERERDSYFHKTLSGTMLPGWGGEVSSGGSETLA